MKYTFSVLMLLYSLTSYAQQYNFPKQVELTILEGLKTFMGEDVFIELSAEENKYQVYVRKFSLYSNDKKEKIKGSSRFVIIKDKKYFIWFPYDDLFCKIIPSLDVEGGEAYTIVFDKNGKVFEKYIQQ